MCICYKQNNSDRREYTYKTSTTVIGTEVLNAREYILLRNPFLKGDLQINKINIERMFIILKQLNTDHRIIIRSNVDYRSPMSMSNVYRCFLA